MSTAEPIWQPAATRGATQMDRFVAAHAPARCAESYGQLHRWSVESRAEFWPALAAFANVRFDTPADCALLDGSAMPGARWFPGASLNFARELLDNDRAGAAIEFASERGDRETWTWHELRAAVAATAAFLQNQGVGRGDHVAGILPNRPETVVAALAAAAIGAVWSSCSPDFGRAALIDRLAQIRPKVLFGTGAYHYAGKVIDCTANLRAVQQTLDGLVATVLVPYALESPAPAIDAVLFDAIPASDAAPPWASLPFDHPLYVLFSSGTTGVPKCIVHGAGGTLLQHLKEHRLHTDIRPGDRVFYFTTCGWMMWNWLVSALASEATLVLYDGSPFHPDPGVLWRLADELGIDIFGTSARYLGALEASGYRPVAQNGLESLRTILSTGSPLAPAQFRYASAAIGADIQVSSIAGGTDIISCFMLGHPGLPVYEGEIQCLGLGMDVRIFDENGSAVTGVKGELVCASPFPSMPLGFLNDPDGTRYRETYFARYPDVWCHGDYAELTEHGGIVIHGRSDAVLNPGGVRIGTSEIYRVVEGLSAVEEAVAVGQDWHGDTRVVLFVRLAGGAELSDRLVDEIRAALREQCSPRHVPAVVLQVSAVPRTISGKVSELAVRDVIHGRAVANSGALANPEALAEFAGRPELET